MTDNVISLPISESKTVDKPEEIIKSGEKPIEKSINKPKTRRERKDKGKKHIFKSKEIDNKSPKPIYKSDKSISPIFKSDKSNKSSEIGFNVFLPIFIVGIIFIVIFYFFRNKSGQSTSIFV